MKQELHKSLRELMEEFMAKVYNGTAHPYRHSVLDEFVTWIEGYEEFIAECDQKIDKAFEAVGLQRVK